MVRTHCTQCFQNKKLYLSIKGPSSRTKPLAILCAKILNTWTTSSFVCFTRRLSFLSSILTRTASQTLWVERLLCHSQCLASLCQSITFGSSWAKHQLVTHSCLNQPTTSSKRRKTRGIVTCPVLCSTLPTQWWRSVFHRAYISTDRA